MSDLQTWSDEKLDRELAFAEGSVGDDPRAAQWLADIKAEIQRRKGNEPASHD